MFLPEAFDSARDSAYQQPGRALEALLKADEVARRYRAGDLPGGLAAAFAECGLSFARDVSATAKGKYPHEYRRTWRGREVMLGPHVSLGAGTPRTCLRIYFHLDEDERLLVVGHVGRHLRDSTTG